MKVSRKYLLLECGLGDKTYYLLLRRYWHIFWWRWESVGPKYPSLAHARQEIDVNYVIPLVVRGTVNDLGWE